MSEVRQVRQRRGRGWGRRMPLVAAPLLAVTAVLEKFLDAPRGETVATVLVAALVLGAATAAQSVLPVAGAVAVALAYPVAAALGAPGISGMGLVGLLLAAGHVGAETRRRTSALAVVAMMVVVVATDVVVHGPTWEVVFLPLTLLPARWAGRLVRRERRRSAELLDLTHQLEAQREAAERAAVTAERARIAREVHDSVAHSVSVMTLQTGGVRRQLAEVLVSHPQEQDVLLGLERLGRQTVDELRGLVGLLRDDDGAHDHVRVDAPASLDRLDDLVDDVRAAGLQITLDVRGHAYALPRALDQAAYRIAQEALTNVLRHAPGAPAEVLVTYAPDALKVQVVNPVVGVDAPTAPSGADASGGHGLLVMRERAALFGGSVRVEPGPERFRVCAHLPVRPGWA